MLIVMLAHAGDTSGVGCIAVDQLPCGALIMAGDWTKLAANLRCLPIGDLTFWACLASRMVFNFNLVQGDDG